MEKPLAAVLDYSGKIVATAEFVVDVPHKQIGHVRIFSAAEYATQYLIPSQTITLGRHDAENLFRFLKEVLEQTN